MLLNNKEILLGVCGGIAAYKVPGLVRLFQDEGAKVQLMMTHNAGHFVTPLTLEAVSGLPVLREMFEAGKGILHLNAVRSADIMVIAPATANMLAKLASGLADDLISTTVLAADIPVLIAPSMNYRMWNNPIVRQNVKKLRGAGYFLMQPDEGHLACGEKGIGRLAELKKIVWEAIRLTIPQDLKGKKVLITAGPTREYADPVRFISSASSGKMGLALAREAYFRGASVTVVAGNVKADLPEKIRVLNAASAGEMFNHVIKKISGNDIFVASAAVSDYRFASVSRQKIKKGNIRIKMDMVLNRDILAEVAKRKKRPFIVGFSLSSGGMLKKAREKLLKKGSDMIVGNGLETVGSDYGEVVLMTAGGTEKLARMRKEMVARNIFDRIVKFF